MTHEQRLRGAIEAEDFLTAHALLPECRSLSPQTREWALQAAKASRAHLASRLAALRPAYPEEPSTPTAPRLSLRG